MPLDRLLDEFKTDKEIDKDNFTKRLYEEFHPILEYIPNKYNNLKDYIDNKLGWCPLP